MSSSIFLLDWANKILSEQNGTAAVMQYKDGISYGISAFSNGNVPTILAIVIAVFITAEFSHGTMKNIVSKGFSKTEVYLSKLITMIAASFILLFITLIAGTVSAAVVTGTFGDFTAAYVGTILKKLGIELFLNAALTSIFVMVAMIVRNLGGVIAIDILFVLNFGPSIFTLLEYLVKSKILFTDYSLIFNINFYVLFETAKGSDYLRSGLVGLVYLIATTAIGIYLFRKTDVK
jgi:ABC-2 type transport system permease protein